jgi:hypothetical protein
MINDNACEDKNEDGAEKHDKEYKKEQSCPATHHAGAKGGRSIAPTHS